MPHKRTSIHLRLYPLLARAVDEGVACGIRRAYKHLNIEPPEGLHEHVEREVLNSLCEVIDFDVLEAQD